MTAPSGMKGCRTVAMTPRRLVVYRAVLAATDGGTREAVGRLAVAGLTDLQVSDLLLRCRDLGLIEAGRVAPGKNAGGRRLKIKRRLDDVTPLPDGEWSLSEPERKSSALAGLWEWDDAFRRSAELSRMNARFAELISKAGSFEDSGVAARAEAPHRRPPPVVTSGCSSATAWHAEGP